MTIWEKVLIVTLIMVMLPPSVYISVKLGTYAFFRGRQLFYEEEEKRSE
jgi:hypothetical protein